MRSFKHTLLALTVSVIGAASGPAWAGTTISTSISDSVSTAVGSLSTSLKKLSQSVAGDDKLTDGDYRVIEMAAAPDRPEHVRLTLKAATPDSEPDALYELTVPLKAVQAHGVQAGQWLVAQNRAYGVMFVKAGAAAQPAAQAPLREPFFLVLDDTWHRELTIRAVAL